MADRTYRVTEIVGTSPESIETAVRNGLRRAGQTLRHLDWFEVTQVRGQIVDGEIAHFQVGLKVGFRLEDD
ncbi:MAG TPA: dodecin [Streptosporangiaceae bacterium]|nr:dodecin [Streptosporangiaceae bacterium]